VTEFGLPGALLVTDRVALAPPVAVGLNVTFTVVVAPAETLIGNCDAGTNPKADALGPVRETFEMFKSAVPLLVMVSV